ncbi:hypothetical protein GN956_G24650 [Arapaima gigas]
MGNEFQQSCSRGRRGIITIKGLSDATVTGSPSAGCGRNRCCRLAYEKAKPVRNEGRRRARDRSSCYRHRLIICEEHSLQSAARAQVGHL